MILEGAGEAYVAMDADGFIVDWNGGAEAIFGWSREEAVGRALAETIVPVRHRETYLRALERFGSTGDGFPIGERIETEGLHREGHEIPVELTVGLSETGDGHHYTALLHDISGRRRAAVYIDAQHAVTRIVAGSSSEDELILGLLPEMGERMGWEYGAFWRWSPASGGLVCARTWTGEGRHALRFASASRELTMAPGEGLI